MLLFLLLFFIFANLTVACFGRKSKALIWVTSLFIILVFVGSRDMADLQNYVYYLEYNSDVPREAGQFLFADFTDLCRYLGFTFDAYRFLLSFIGMTFYYLLIVKFCPLPNLVYAAYLSYLMIMDDVQIRNFLGCAVFCYSLTFILAHNKHWRCRYLVALTIASLIHASFWVYLIFLFVPNNLSKKSRGIELFGLMIVAFSVLVLFMRSYLDSFVTLLAIVDKDKAEGYYEIPTQFGGAIYGVIQITSLLGILYIKRVISSSKFVCKHNYQKLMFDIQIMHVIYLLDILALICVPTVILSITFNRLIRNLFILNMMGFSIGLYYLKNKLIPLVLVVVITYIYFRFDLTQDWRIKEIMDPFFNSNVIF